MADHAQRFQRPILITAPISHFRVVPFIKRHVSETTFAVQNPAGSGRRQAVPLHGILHDKDVFDTHVLAARRRPRWIFRRRRS